MCIKWEKKQHMWDKERNTYIIIIYWNKTWCNVCRWLQNQKIHYTKYINIKVYQTNKLTLPLRLLHQKIFFSFTWSSPPKFITPPKEWHANLKFLPLFATIVKGHRKPKKLDQRQIENWQEGIRKIRNHRPTKRTWQQDAMDTKGEKKCKNPKDFLKQKHKFLFF